MVLLYAILSVVLVSIVSLVGVLVFIVGEQRVRHIIPYMVSLAVGGLFGDAFFHLLPEASESGFTVSVSVAVLTGIILFFIIEKVVHWRHCHHTHNKKNNHHSHCHHHHSFATMNLIGDGVHNFIDGLIIGASYLVSVPVGVATTVAVIFHEIPQELGDFGVLLHAGYTKTRALFMNFLTALTAVLGAIVAIVIRSYSEPFALFLLPLAAGGFIYIAAADLIPEIHKETDLSKSLLHFLVIMIGIGFMYGLTFLE